ncbi:amino acid transporter, putative [Bodo saltans]|uniref:Amino acid transporter, putative n=1 Tax=Bodo saltans TaxID=75058 RepID=A0A0S4J4N4_BODSA|nr:amino acid transporter, putative [Bodo saltans]|eukprot:CUG86177.1 amino acid transporter, putative [Bodo saltans]
MQNVRAGNAEGDDHHHLVPSYSTAAAPVVVVVPLSTNASSRSSSSEDENEDAAVPVDDHDGHDENGTVMGTTFNTITNVIGGGVLGLPNAMFQASIAVGVVLMVISALMSTFAVYILVKACDYYGRYAMRDVWALALYPQAPHNDIIAAVHRKRELDAKKADVAQSYQTGEATSASASSDEKLETTELDAFLAREEKNHKMRAFMSDLIVLMMILYNFGCLVLYGVVIGESLPPVVENFFGASGLWLDNGTWLIAAGVVFFFFTCAKKLSELKWSSILGAITIFYVIIAVVIRYFTFKAHPEDMPSFNQDTDVLDVASFQVGLANAMTTFGLAYCYHYNVPYYYKELKDRNAKKMMLTVAFSQPVTFTSYLLTGLFGYLTFGAAVNNAHSGGSIVDNYAEDDTLVNVGRFGLFFHFVCVYPIISLSCRRGLHHLIMTHIVRPFWRYREHRRHQHHHHQHDEHHGAINQQQSSSSLNVTAAAGDQNNNAATVAGDGEPIPSTLHQHGVKINMLETATEEPDPSRAIVALESFCIVAASISCAWVAPGIKIVINITGSLFGLFMMMIAPGLVGVCLFQRTRTCTTGEFHGPTETRKYILSWVLLVLGAGFVVSSFYTIVK